MLNLRRLQHALESLYRVDPVPSINDFLQPMRSDDPHRARREVVLVKLPRKKDQPIELSVRLAPEVFAALMGERVEGLSRFHAWCLTVEAVSHFLLLAHRARVARPVSQIELELQAEIDKFLVGLIDRVVGRTASEAHDASRKLRLALYQSPQFLDPPHTVRGRRYRAAHSLAAKYAAYLERNFVRDARTNDLVEEVRGFYRNGWDEKRNRAEAA